jgi:hypothetical protein
MFLFFDQNFCNYQRFFCSFGIKKFSIQSFRLNNIFINLEVHISDLKKICEKLLYTIDNAFLSFTNSYKRKKITFFFFYF